MSPSESTPDWLVGLRDRALAIADGTLSPVIPRDAATVVLLREAAEKTGLEVYLLERTGTMAFAAGMTVFPGGAVDLRDTQGGLAWVGPPPEFWVGPLRAMDAPHAQAIVCAAVRETFEESGILLAGVAGEGENGEEGEHSLVDDVSGADWETDRIALVDGSLSMAEMLRNRGLALRADLLFPWAHWITPAAEPRRYDTRFLVAALPAGQTTRDVSTESSAVAWRPPQEALDLLAAGRLAMLPPTAATLGSLVEFSGLAAVAEAAETRRIVTVAPRVIVVDGEVRLALPGDDGSGDGHG